MNNTKLRSLPTVRLVLCLSVAALAAACGQETRVDPALVGAWEIPVPGGRWVLTIDAAGEYTFVNEAAGPAPSHSGEFLAHDGEWSLRSTTLALEDHGTYRAGADGVVELTGNRGTLRWGRSKPPPEEPPVIAAAPSTAPVLPTAAPPPAAVTARAPSAAAAPAPARTAPSTPAAAVVTPRGGTVPETIDPCTLVTAAEATKLLGAEVETVRKTPQAHMQNDCLYRVGASAAHSVSVSSYNGGGINPEGYLERRRKEGGEPLAGVGDGAVSSYRDATGLASAAFVVGTATVEILVAGVARARALPAVQTFAAEAASRLVSPASSFAQPGLERFVGAWMVTGQGAGKVKLVVWVERDGQLKIETAAGFSGTLLLDGASWRVDEGLNNPDPPRGQYRVRGEHLTLSGELVAGDLTRVACRAEPKIRPPYDLTRDAAAFLAGRNLARINPNAPPAEQFDAALAGLWEGEGTVSGKHAEMLIAIDDRGRSVFALFPLLEGRLSASAGHYEMSLDTLGKFSGGYHFQGGISDGSIELEDTDQTMIWTPYDPNRRPPYETPLLGHCN
jgi:hypothetical protein